MNEINQAPLLEGKNVILRKPKLEDQTDRLRCGRTYEFIHGVGGDTRNIKPFTKEDAKRWYEQMLKNKYEWVVVYRNHCIGIARLTVNEMDNKARYAVGIFDDSKLNQGFGQEITKLVLDFAFKKLKLHRVDLRVLEYNKRAVYCYEKCGFQIEGKERDGAFIEGKYQTDLMMSLLEDEYRRIYAD